MAVNLRAAFVMTRLADPLMSDRRGAIVNVGSVHAVATTGDAAAYTAAKAGLLGLTRAMAIELGGRGIRVNAVIPGAIDTPMLRGGSGDPARLQRIAGRTPLGRIGRPRDVAEASPSSPIPTDRRSSPVRPWWSMAERSLGSPPNDAGRGGGPRRTHPDPRATTRGPDRRSVSRPDPSGIGRADLPARPKRPTIAGSSARAREPVRRRTVLHHRQRPQPGQHRPLSARGRIPSPSTEDTCSSTASAPRLHSWSP